MTEGITRNTRADRDGPYDARDGNRRSPSVAVRVAVRALVQPGRGAADGAAVLDVHRVPAPGPQLRLREQRHPLGVLVVPDVGHVHRQLRGRVVHVRHEHVQAAAVERDLGRVARHGHGRVQFAVEPRRAVARRHRHVVRDGRGVRRQPAGGGRRRGARNDGGRQQRDGKR